MSRHKAIFISASIPAPSELEAGLPPVDATAVRDALIACIAIILAHTNYHIVWGGHPSITSLISYILRSELNINLAAETLSETELAIKERFHLYQSKHFTADERPADNRFFNTILTEKKTDLKSSLTHMRETMLAPESHDIVLGVFLGGRQKGLSEEIQILLRQHPNTLILPVATTGGYSAIVHTSQTSWCNKGILQKFFAKDEQSSDIIKLCSSCRYYSLFRSALSFFDQTGLYKQI